MKKVSRTSFFSRSSSKEELLVLESVADSETLSINFPLHVDATAEAAGFRVLDSGAHL
jgi:hypothetical protein